MNYYSIVSLVAVILLILALTGVGILLSGNTNLNVGSCANNGVMNNLLSLPSGGNYCNSN